MASPRVPTALRTVAAAALVVLTGGALVRTIAASFDPFQPYPGHTADYGITRSRAIRSALPQIVASPQEGVIFLGSSGLGRAFVPGVFDDALDHGHGRYASFNLAQLLFQPETALAMAKVIRQSYEASHKRIGITIFGVSVPELTRGAVQAARRGMPAGQPTKPRCPTAVRAFWKPWGARRSTPRCPVRSARPRRPSGVCCPQVPTAR